MLTTITLPFTHPFCVTHVVVVLSLCPQLRPSVINPSILCAVQACTGLTPSTGGELFSRLIFLSQHNHLKTRNGCTEVCLLWVADLLCPDRARVSVALVSACSQASLTQQVDSSRITPLVRLHLVCTCSFDPRQHFAVVVAPSIKGVAEKHNFTSKVFYPYISVI